MPMRKRRHAAHRPPAFLPDSVEVEPRRLRVGDDWVATLVVVGYPREVHAGWLQPLLSYPGRLDVSLHIEPVAPAVAADRLKRQLAKLESGRRHTADHGRLADPLVDAATEDALDLSARLARGEGRLFRLGLVLTVHAASAEELTAEITAVRTLAASLLLDARPTTFRSLQGWITTLPMGMDLVDMTRTFDTAALATAFPFASPDLPPPEPVSVGARAGVLYGRNLASQGLVHWDRFVCDNHNAVILGRSGSGKSYLVKLEALRSLYRGVEIAVIDPEDEYARLAHAVGGTYLALGTPGVRINPLDLPITRRADGHRAAPNDAVQRRSLFLHTLLEVLFGQPLAADERATLDRAITATYARAGITSDPRSWTRPTPLLADLQKVLGDHGSPGGALADQLRPYTDGAFSGLFDGPTTTSPLGHLQVFSLRAVPEELKPAATLLVLDAIWRWITNPADRRPRYVVVDEAWLLMRQRAGAEFLFRLAKSARKHWAGLTVATQDVGDVLGSDLGKAVIANAATQILLRQAPQAIDEIVRAFTLSEGERQFLLSAERGQALLASTSHRVVLQATASEFEHSLLTTDPAELAAGDDDQAAAIVDLDTL